MALERAKERTAKLQIALPILISILALGLALNEYRRSVQTQEIQQEHFDIQRRAEVRESETTVIYEGRVIQEID